MEAIDINHLIRQDFVQSKASWATALCQKLRDLSLPTLTFYVHDETHALVFKFEKDTLSMGQQKDGKRRLLEVFLSKSFITINGRVAQKEEIPVLLMMIKTGILLGKKSGFFALTTSDSIQDLLQKVSQHSAIDGAAVSTEAMRLLAVLGKSIHTQTEQGTSLISTFVEKTKLLFLGMKSTLKRLVIKNDVQKPKPELKYMLSIEEGSGKYVEKSHFVSNTIQVDFSQNAISINAQPITSTGCTWFSDRLGHLSQDLASGRAELYEGS